MRAEDCGGRLYLWVLRFRCVYSWSRTDLFDDSYSPLDDFVGCAGSTRVWTDNIEICGLAEHQAGCAVTTQNTSDEDNSNIVFIDMCANVCVDGDFLCAGCVPSDRDVLFDSFYATCHGFLTMLLSQYPATWPSCDACATPQNRKLISRGASFWRPFNCGSRPDWRRSGVF